MAHNNEGYEDILADLNETYFQESVKRLSTSTPKFTLMDNIVSCKKEQLLEISMYLELDLHRRTYKKDLVEVISTILTTDNTLIINFLSIIDLDELELIEELVANKYIESEEIIKPLKYLMSVGLVYGYRNKTSDLFYYVMPDEIKEIYLNLSNKKQVYKHTIDLNRELALFFNAAAALYGVIKLELLYDIYLDYHVNSTIVIPFDLFKNSCNLLQLKTTYFFVDDELFMIDYFVNVENQQDYLFSIINGEAPYYKPEYKEFLNYADAMYYERNQWFIDMENFLINNYSLDKTLAEDITCDIQLYNEIGSLDDVFNELGRFEIEFKDKQQINDFMDIYTELVNHTRTWLNHGNYPVDILNVPKNVPTSKKVKVGRNDPCPCGSGKKYKKCCLNKENKSSANNSKLAKLEQMVTLYELGEVINELAPWDDLWDMDLIAVRAKEYKEDTYCCTMGKSVGLYGVFLYYGYEGLRDLYRMNHAVELKIPDDYVFNDMNCLSMAYSQYGSLLPEYKQLFKKLGHKYKENEQCLIFESFEKEYVKTLINEDEANLMIDCLGKYVLAYKQYIKNKEIIDFDKDYFLRYDEKLQVINKPTIKLNYGPYFLEDELLIKKLENTEMNRGTYEVDLTYTNVSITDGEYRKELWPKFFIMANTTTGIIFDSDYLQPDELVKTDAYVCNRFANNLLKHGIPNEIIIRNSHLLSILGDLCIKLGIHIELTKRLPISESLVESFISDR